MRKKLLCLAFAFILFLCQIVIWTAFFKPSAEESIEILNEGWEVIYNDTVYENIKLSALRRLIGHGTHRGDTLLLAKDLDALEGMDSPTIFFETRFSAWSLRFGGQEISTRYYDYFDKNRYIGCENHYITMPSSTGKVRLEIELKVNEDGAYSYYEAPVLGDYRNVIKYLVYRDFFVFMASVFLIIFGLMFFAITLGFRSTLPEIKMQTFSSLLFVTLGIWFLTQFRLLSLFVNTHGHETELEYISLYLAVPIIYMVIGSMQDYLHYKPFIVFASTSTVVALAPILIHALNLDHMNEYLGIYQFNALVLACFMISMLIRDIKTRKITNSQAIQLAGMIVLTISFVINVFFYYLEVVGVYEQILLSKVAVPVGALCMVFAALINYYIYISDSYARKKENASLAHLAYADGLTGLPNRSKFEQYLTDLDKSDKNYCILSIDLNGLKSVNDRSGHLIGDRYLLEFSKALRKSAPEDSFIARIGGDEFVMILTGNSLNKAEDVATKLSRELELYNAADKRIKRSAALGYAYRHEAAGADYHDVYLLADQRMYANKSAMKIRARHNA